MCVLAEIRLSPGVDFTLELTEVDLPEAFCSYDIVLDDLVDNNYWFADF
jgi:hypothetical protein